MKPLDLTPLYRDSVGFDRLASLLDNTLRGDSIPQGYPPYNIESLDDTRYAVTLALPGFRKTDLSISVENGVLTVRGSSPEQDDRNFLHRGIATRPFERKFTLADYVEVTDARFADGLLTIELVKEIPEAMRPKTISIHDGDAVADRPAQHTIEHRNERVTGETGGKTASEVKGGAAA